jgi:hypothetical protein
MQCGNWWRLVPTTNHFSFHCSVSKTPAFSSLPWYALVVYCSQCFIVLKPSLQARCKSSSPPALQVCWHHIHLCLFTSKECFMLCLFILQWWLTVFNIFGIKICYDFPFKGISSGAQFVTLKICLWHPSFGCLHFFQKYP